MGGPRTFVMGGQTDRLQYAGYDAVQGPARKRPSLDGRKHSVFFGEGEGKLMPDRYKSCHGMLMIPRGLAVDSCDRFWVLGLGLGLVLF